MPTFGDYETIDEIASPEERGHVTTVWKARKSGAHGARLFAIKCYAPRIQTPNLAQTQDALQRDRALEFLAGIKDLKQAHSEGARFLVPVHAFGIGPEGAWYATDFCPRKTLKEFIGTGGNPDTAMLRHIVHCVAAGCLELKRSRASAKYSHGNLKPSNILLAGRKRALRKTPLLLADPHPGPLQLTGLDLNDLRTTGNLLAQVVEAQDLRAIGELIYQLVEGRLVKSADDYNYPVGRSDRWDRLRKDGEFWRELCNRLLDPKLSLETESLEKLAKEFRPRPVHDNLPIIAGAAGVICLVGAGVCLLWTKPLPRDTLSVTADDQSRAYGDPNPLLTGKVSGLQKADGIKITYDTKAVASNQVGSYYIVPMLTDPSSNRLTKYPSVITNWGKLTVIPRLLKIDVGNQTREYGTSNPELTGKVDGLLKDDGIQVSYRAEAKESSAADQYPIVPLLSDPNQKLGNYQVTTNRGLLTITRAELTLSATNMSRYEGETNPLLTGSIRGVRNNDPIDITFHTTANPNSPPGEYDIVPGLKDPKKLKSNYNVRYNTNKLTVLRKQSGVEKPLLTITANDQSRLYRTPNPRLSGTTNGLLSGDLITVTFSTAALEDSDMGWYDILPEIGDPNGKLGKYRVVTNRGTLTIKEAALTVVATNLSRAYGTTNPPLAGWITANKDKITATNTTQADERSSVGKYDIVPALIDPLGKLSNYTVTMNGGTLTITNATLTVAASNLSRLFGVTNPPLTGWITPNRDGVTAIYETKADTNSLAGEYDIKPSLVGPAHKLVNYRVTTNKGTLRITSKRSVPLTVSAVSYSRAYGTTNPLLSVSVTTNPDAISATNSTSANVDSPVGNYSIVPSLIDPHGKQSSYTVTTNRGTLTITNATLTVTASNLSRPFGDSNPLLTGWITSNRDGITATYETTADATSAAGDYDIKPVLKFPPNKLVNYTVTTNKGKLTITAAPTVVATNLAGLGIDIDFVQIPQFAPRVWVAVDELSAQQYSNLCSKFEITFEPKHYLDYGRQQVFQNAALPAYFHDFPDATKFVSDLNNHLKSESFRLLTLGEYTNLVRLAGVPIENDGTNLSLAWENIKELKDNGESTTRLPRGTTNGLPNKLGLRDLIGNVREWAAPSADGSKAIPFGFAHFFQATSTSSRALRNLIKSQQTDESIGLRLVYTETPPGQSGR